MKMARNEKKTKKQKSKKVKKEKNVSIYIFKVSQS
jgi:hypothetical protein